MTNQDSAPHVLYFSRGRGRGHAFPDLAVMESLYLCSPLTSDHVQELVEAMQTGPLDDDEEQHLLFLGMLAQGKASMASATGSPSRP